MEKNTYKTFNFSYSKIIVHFFITILGTLSNDDGDAKDNA